jgi:tetratricopeptide (TPR) repeat protein
VTEQPDAPRPGRGNEDRRQRPDPGPADDERETAYELFQRGHDLLRRRHHAQAAVVLERAARLEPGKGSILEALGRAYYNSAQHERSRETFEALLEIDPSAHYAHYALGQSLKKLGRDREAWTHLRLAVALAPSSTLYRSALGRMPAPRRHDPASS